MSWEYLRKEVADKRLDSFLTEKGDEGWELAYVRRGKETRVNRDPDVWEVIFRRLKSAPKSAEAGAPGRNEEGLGTPDVLGAG